ncbi:hypothetical protein KAH94_00405 [bacterium]|nr:hypothetical protein [bacterium]
MGKNKIKKILLIITVLQTQQFYAHERTELYGKSFFLQRSDATNGARQLVGTHPITHKQNRKKSYGLLWTTPEYLHAFKTRSIAEHFFAVDTIRFSGSQVTSRSDDDILADYFGMSPTFDSLINLNPTMKTFVMDFGFHIGMDGFCPGLYLTAHAPYVWKQSGIRLCEKISENGTDTLYPAEYMDESKLKAPAESAKTPFKGATTWGHVTEPLKYGKMGCLQTRTKLSDIQVTLGYNFIRREKGHVGINLFFVGPTGNKPTNEYLFEPIIGNGKHWAIGAGLTGSRLLWEKDGDQTLNFHLDLQLSHLFTSCQKRSFDLTCNRFGTRYTLLKEFDSTGAYTGVVVPVINKTTVDCDISIPFQMDAVFMFGYRNNNWTFDFGYNGWIRSREKLCIRGSIESNKYGLKGIQNVTGADVNNTQSTATLHGNTLDGTTQTATADDPSPVFLKTSDLDACSAEMERSVSHKFFVNLSYAWEKYNRKAIPFIGAGAEVEFDGEKNYNTLPNKNTLSQFGLWLKGGLTF